MVSVHLGALACFTCIDNKRLIECNLCSCITNMYIHRKCSSATFCDIRLKCTCAKQKHVFWIYLYAYKSLPRGRGEGAPFFQCLCRDNQPDKQTSEQTAQSSTRADKQTCKQARQQPNERVDKQPKHRRLNGSMDREMHTHTNHKTNQHHSHTSCQAQTSTPCTHTQHIANVLHTPWVDVF